MEHRLCVHNDEALKNTVLEEAHSLAYVMHPGSTKMYMTLKKSYWWSGMKKDIAGYVDRCLICQQVIVYRMTKTIKFFPVRATSTLNQLAKTHVDRVVSQYRASVSIVSDRDPWFTLKFWPSL
ncbi:uncharacterized protein LOC120077385 [Benincasa hispida]|uniref:uncharacterized protein LOC120077385 n=1 Tax=Benincasa hispida TaxID=102211 RepID=UPI001900B03A|nr:uncharacterized protein LOC120077385 [Benincasa hispida]